MTTDPTINTELSGVVSLAEADIAAIVNAIRPVVADEIQKALPALQQSGAQLVTTVEEQHAGLLSKIEAWLHPVPPVPPVQG